MLKLTDKVKEVLLLSFIKKCKTRNCYSFFSELARDEGYENIAKIFNSNAEMIKEEVLATEIHYEAVCWQIPKKDGRFT